eukprot:TRINITY_DN6457_c0_g1_i1.p1 TRINITY_DN6457_c0_g1~~TRINITY_DN6457_c0_g1_i1.p1  ORF type:complete len:608 (-),score=172.45 TRINITY_DN6457_c0_g1_i1:115-1890(-)
MKDLVGMSQHLEESAQFRDLSARAKTTKRDVELQIKTSVKYTEAAQESAVATRKLGDEMNRWAAGLTEVGSSASGAPSGVSVAPTSRPNDAEFVVALAKCGNMLTCVQEIQDGMAARVNMAYKDGLQTFLDQDMADWEKARKKYEKGRADYEEALAEAKAARESSKIDATRLLQLEAKCASAKGKYEVLLDEATDQLLHVDGKKEYFLLQQLQVFLKIQAEYFQAGHQLMQQFQPYIDSLDFAIGQSKNDFVARKRERAEERQRALDGARKSRYFPLVEMLAEPSLELLTALCQGDADQQEETLRYAIRALDAYLLLVPLIKAGIHFEVEQTSHPQTLFRGNSTSTRLIVGYCKFIAMPIVQTTLKPCVDQLLLNPTRSFELDPEKLGEGEVLESNVKKLELVAQHFLDAIFSTADSCPIQLRVILNNLQENAKLKFPDAPPTQAVGAFVFLRLYCPALITPNQFGLCKETPPPPTRRALLLIVKILQNLANGILFGAKEAYMKPMNEFIEANLHKVRDFLAALSVVPDSVVLPPPSASIEAVDGGDLPALHRLLVTDVDRISASLQQANGTIKPAQLTEVLGALGQPPPR